MAILQSNLTKDDLDVLLEALDEWKSNATKRTRTTRRDKAILVMAKLLLLKRSLRIEALDLEAKPTRDDRKLQVAEQFMLDCGIWTHFQRFLEEHVAKR